MSLFNFQPENAIDKGNEALKYFHNWSLGNFADKYLISFDELKEIYGGKQQDLQIAGLGDVINDLDMSSAQVEEAMRDLAMQAKGNVPHTTVFFQALGRRLSNLTPLDWVKATPEVALNSILDVAKGAQAIGNSVITTGKIATWILPVVVIGAGLYILTRRTKQLAG